MTATAQHAYDTADDLIEDYHRRGWTDGLPIVPPTPERVAGFLAHAGLGGHEVLGTVPTREVTCTAEQVAANAVMAGCRPEDFPVVVAAVRAHLHPKGNCHSTTGTLSGAAQAVIVNGPVRHDLGVASGAGCFGPGFRANATIGRALRLVIRNVCRGIPGFLDRASFSTPARYSFCFGENEEASAWEPLHVQRGLAPDQSAVTVHSLMKMVEATDFTSRSPEGVCDSLVTCIRANGIAGDSWLGEDGNVVIVIGHEHHRYFIEEGWSKADLQEYLWPRLNAPATSATDRMARIGKPEGILVVAAGGAGMAASWLLLPHLALAITEPVV
ncbi:hypothetical protein [Candidatus Poriferisocius sp.]|uniref:hypothetical protein n=1 Tax=Candidatus Poriferisocius sp. TaxID=3101276 RepID=UPI003B5C902A